jgi:hypothetical protein
MSRNSNSAQRTHQAHDEHGLKMLKANLERGS